MGKISAVLLAGVVTVVTAVSGVNALASNACLDSGLIQQIQSKVNLKTKDFNGFDACQPNTNTYKIYQALSLVRTIQFDASSLAKPFNQDILPNDFWTYFTGRVTTVQDEATCPTNVLAFVYGGRNDGIVHLCPDLYKNEITLFERAETMLHEARHFEGYAHVTCSRGPRNGQSGACDDSVGEVGSYAVTVETLTKMAISMKDLASTQRTMVKVLALTYANEVFNEPIRARDLSAFYLITDDNRGMIYSDLGAVQVATLSGSHLISRGSALAVFPDDKSDAYTANVFSPSLQASPAMGSFSAKYNAMPQASRPSVIDIMNLGYVTASVTGTQVQASLRGSADKINANTQFEIKAAYSGEEIGRPDQDSIYVVDNQNSMYRIQFTSGNQASINQVENPLGNMTQVAIFNDSRLALDSNGTLVSEANGSWTPFAPLASTHFTKLTRPFLWDQYFEDASADISSTLK